MQSQPGGRSGGTRENQNTSYRRISEKTRARCRAAFGNPAGLWRSSVPYAHGRGGLPKRTHRVRLPTVHRSPIESVTWVRAPPAYHPPAALMSEDDDVPTMDKCAVR